MTKYKNTISRFKLMTLAVVAAFSFQACDEYGSDWPDEASIADVTPPAADFGAKVNVANPLTVDFTNYSSSATTYAWDFGDGGTSTDKDASHDYADFGIYTVTLTASDKLGAVNVSTQEVVVDKPLVVFTPTILNPGFESGTANWTNSSLGGVVQVTTSPVSSGAQAGKFPSAGDRIAYQSFTVEKNKIYTLSFWYTLKTSPAGSLKVAVLAGEVNATANVAAATLSSVTGKNQDDANVYVQESVTFNSKDNTTVSILVTNTGAEARIDDFKIVTE